MKITPKKYAESLLEATEGKSKKEVEGIVARLVNVMAVNKDLNKFELVSKYFSKSWNAKNGIVVVDVTTANDLNDKMTNNLSDFILKMLKVEKIKIRSKIDKSILGGVIIKQGDTIYDGSLRSRLYSLKEVLSK